jgi:hypothetical protein
MEPYPIDKKKKMEKSGHVSDPLATRCYFCVRINYFLGKYLQFLVNLTTAARTERATPNYSGL